MLPPGTVSPYMTGLLAVFADVAANILLLVDRRQIAAGAIRSLSFET